MPGHEIHLLATSRAMTSITIAASEEESGGCHLDSGNGQ